MSLKCYSVKLKDALLNYFLRWISILLWFQSTLSASDCVVTGLPRPAWKVLQSSWRNTWRGLEDINH